MTDLLLQPTGNPSQYEVIENAQIVGRISLFHALRDQRKPWICRSTSPSVPAMSGRMAPRRRWKPPCRRSPVAGTILTCRLSTLYGPQLRATIGNSCPYVILAMGPPE